MMTFYQKSGISKYPEIIEFCGNLSYVIDNEEIKYNKKTQGSYINSYNVVKMQNLKVLNANKIIFIENKANYIDYIQNKMQNNEFVIYHGGMYSPIKGKFFKKIYNSCKKCESINLQKFEFYHWSDIDLGGFNIFIRLKELIPELKPYLMDKQAFYNKQKYWQKMPTKYESKLKELLNDEKYTYFFELINEMLYTHCKLEQEAFI